MDLQLTDTEVRVLGCLIEKEFSTPEYYPMTLNSLVNACNQKSNRDPVVSYDEAAVLQALEGLKHKQLAFQSNSSRVAKYEETFLGAHNFIGSEASVLCELMVRGPQTPAELRSRTERMHEFKTPDEFSDALAKLESYGYCLRLERQPGRKEARYAHLLSGPVRHADAAAGQGRAITAAAGAADRIAALEDMVNGLQQELHDLRQAFLDFKRQLD